MKQISRRARRMDMILFLMFTQNEHAYIEYMLTNWRYANLKQLLCTRGSKTLIIFKSFELKKWNFLVKLFKTIGGKAGQRVRSYSFKSINDRWLYRGKPFGFIVPSEFLAFRRDCLRPVVLVVATTDHVTAVQQPNWSTEPWLRWNQCMWSLLQFQVPLKNLKGREILAWWAAWRLRRLATDCLWNHFRVLLYIPEIPNSLEHKSCWWCDKISATWIKILKRGHREDVGSCWQ